MLRVIALFFFCFVSLAQAADPAPSAPAINQGVVVKAQSQFTEGVQYKVLPPAAAEKPTAKALLETHQGKVEVINFFSYGCPVCNRLEPEVNRWNNSKKATQMVAFVDVPVDWNHSGWENLARAFYVAESLNVLDKIQPAIFAAVHQQGKNFKNKADLEQFFLATAGVSRQDFEKTYDSFNVRRRMKQGELLLADYGVMAIPAFVINGKYYVDVQTAGGIDKVIPVLEFLVNKESFTQDTETIDFSDVEAKPNRVAPPSAQPKQELVPSTPAP